MLKQAPARTCGPMERRYPPAACEGLHAGAGGCTQRRLWSRFAGKICDPVERTHAVTVCEEL